MPPGRSVSVQTTGVVPTGNVAGLENNRAVGFDKSYSPPWQSFTEGKDQVTPAFEHCPESTFNVRLLGAELFIRRVSDDHFPISSKVLLVDAVIRT